MISRDYGVKPSRKAACTSSNVDSQENSRRTEHKETQALLLTGRRGDIIDPKCLYIPCVVPETTFAQELIR